MQNPTRRRTLGALALVTSAALALSACGSSGGDEPAAPEKNGGSSDGGGSEVQDVTLTFAWWGTDPRHAVTNEALDAFEDKYPHITVERDFGGFDGYRDRVVSRFAASNPPDVFQLYGDVQGEFESRGQLLDLEQYPDQLDLSAWSEAQLAPGRSDKGLGTLDFGLSAAGMVLNTSLFNQYGIELPPEDWTWEDFASTADAITAASGGEVHGTMDGAFGYQILEIWAKQQGQEYFDSDGLGFSPDVLEGYWAYWAAMRESGGATPADVTAEVSAPMDLLNEGRIAMGFIFANQYAGTSEAMPGDSALYRMPGDAKSPGSYLRSSMTIGAAATSEHPEEAALLVDFLLNDAEAAAILGVDRGAPPNPEMSGPATAGLSELDKVAVALIDSVRENGAPRPPMPPAGAEQVNLDFVELGQAVAFGQMSLSDAVEEFINRGTQVFGG